MLHAPSLPELSAVINQSIAPAFILGAVSGFISVLVTRLNRIIDRCRVLCRDPSAAAGPDTAAALARLNVRAVLINRALFWAVVSALITIIMMILAFAYAFFSIPREIGVALLFVGALISLGIALVSFAWEIRIVIADPNNFD